MLRGKHLSVALLAWITALWPAGILAAEPERPTATPSAPTPAEFDDLLRGLDHRLFAERERATDALLAAGPPAVPHLAEAVQGESLEAADRAVWILRQHAKTGDENLQLEALEVLASAERFPTVRRKAEVALTELHQALCQRRLESLGATFVVGPNQQQIFGSGVQVNVNTARDEWRGEPDDLLTLTKLRNVAQLKITSPDLDNQHLNKLAEIDGLAYLTLVETQVTFDKVEKLKQEHPGLRIVLRSRARLGVAFGDTGTLVVSQVQPGTPAERAGLQIGDQVISFAGHEVDDFDQLTAYIAQHAPGEEVDITVLRGDQQVTMSAKLVAHDWSTDQLP